MKEEREKEEENFKLSVIRSCFRLNPTRFPTFVKFFLKEDLSHGGGQEEEGEEEGSSFHLFGLKGRLGKECIQVRE